MPLPRCFMIIKYSVKDIYLFFFLSLIKVEWNFMLIWRKKNNVDSWLYIRFFFCFHVLLLTFFPSKASTWTYRKKKIVLNSSSLSIKYVSIYTHLKLYFIFTERNKKKLNNLPPYLLNVGWNLAKKNIWNATKLDFSDFITHDFKIIERIDFGSSIFLLRWRYLLL